MTDDPQTCDGCDERQPGWSKGCEIKAKSGRTCAPRAPVAGPTAIDRLATLEDRILELEREREEAHAAARESAQRRGTAEGRLVAVVGLVRERCTMYPGLPPNGDDLIDMLQTIDRIVTRPPPEPEPKPQLHCSWGKVVPCIWNSIARAAKGGAS